MAGRNGSNPDADPARRSPPLAATPTEAMGRSIERALSVGSTGHGRGEARYRLLATIAKGGMGEVFLAQAEGSGAPKKVIIKRLLAELRENKEYREMFRFEAEVLTRLAHPNIVAMVDLPLIDGVPCIALEYVPGRSLARIMEKLFESDRKMPPLFAGKILLHVLDALQHAHDVKLSDGSSLELVHRDVTPGNVLVSFSGQVKLTDFGIAKGKTAGFSTTAGIVKGKARYLSPEQILGERATPRSDVFSASCVGVEILSGLPLFERASVPKTLEAIVQGLRPSLSELLPVEAAHFIPVLERGLARDPSFRHQTARQMAQVWTRALDSIGGLAPDAALGTFISELFAGAEEPWEKLPERPVAVEADNPIYTPPDQRDETIKELDTVPGFDESTDERPAQARIETMVVRDRDQTQRDAPDRQATVLEGEEETLHLGANNPLDFGKATELMRPATPEPGTPVVPVKRPTSAVLRVTMPKDPAEPPGLPERPRPSVPVSPLPVPKGPETSRVRVMGREAPLLAVIAFIFLIGAISGVVVTRVLKSSRGAEIATAPLVEPLANEAPLIEPPPLPTAPVVAEAAPAEPVAVEPVEPAATETPAPVLVPAVLNLVFPKGGRVRLDGDWQKERVPVQLEADAGSHEIEIQHRRRRYRVVVTVENGQTLTVDRALLGRPRR